MNKTLNHRMEHFIRRFRLGISLFFVGFVTLYAIDQLLGPSVVQEVLAGLALLLIAGGFGLAVVAEALFLGYRVWVFFSSK